jgi:hypothetical protein
MKDGDRYDNLDIYGREIRVLRDIDMAYEVSPVRQSITTYILNISSLI